MERDLFISCVVLFESELTDDQYMPVVPYLPRMPFVHGLDADIAPALNPIWACLHLPRAVTDCYGVEFSVLAKVEVLDIPHVIICTPLGALRAGHVKKAPLPSVFLVITPDETIAEATILTELWSPRFGVAGYSSLNQQSIDSYWARVAEIGGEKAVRRRGPPLTGFSDCGVERLSVLHRIRQLGPPELRAELGCDPVASNVIREAIGAASFAKAVAALEEDRCPPQDFDARFPEALRIARIDWHLAIGHDVRNEATTRARVARSRSTSITFGRRAGAPDPAIPDRHCLFTLAPPRKHPAQQGCRNRATRPDVTVIPD